MTTTDRTHETDETFRAEIERIEKADHGWPQWVAHAPIDEPWHADLAHRFVLLGDPFRAEGEPGVDG